MTDQMVVKLVSDAFLVVLYVVGPLLLASLIVGLTISIFQAATSISEQTLTFVPKLLTVFLVIVLLLPYMLEKLMTFTKTMIEMIPNLT